jgi:hypothetical protein
MITFVSVESAVAEVVKMGGSMSLKDVVSAIRCGSPKVSEDAVKKAIQNLLAQKRISEEQGQYVIK